MLNASVFSAPTLFLKSFNIVIRNISMTPKQRDVLALTFFVIALIVLNYGWLDDVLNNFLTGSETVHIDRIIDGDTVESNSTSIRLLGINAPERGEYLYDGAKEFLEDKILNQTVYLKYGKERYDKYNRILAYIFLNNTNINIKLVENGYANYYFYGGKDEYSNELLGAWEICLNNNVNLCEKSNDVCVACIDIKNSNTITNNCNFECDINEWEIKGEGRNKFIFNKSLGSNQETFFGLDLSDSGGSLFLRDGKGLLVKWRGSN